jgi:hypothetical protein
MNLIKTAGITEFKKGIKKMQVDFHYYCIFVLAYYAGFKKEEARKIAYSSQYVDDATESKPINFEQFSFDPIRTAYYSLKAYDWDIQKKIYIPFHFLPSTPLRSTNEFTYVTEPNSQFAKLLLLEAEKEKTENWLHRLGIALHTYADTWAHNGFSGRQNNENRVEDINLYEREKWKKPLWENILLDAFPTIGHCEANRYPDYSFLKWKYKNHKNQSIERDNTQIFLTAAETILKELCNITGKRRVNWQEIEETIKQLFLCDIDLNKKCKAWGEQFPKIFEKQDNTYDKITWRKEALGTETDKNYQRDDIPPEKFETLKFGKKEDFFNSNWVKFQRAAFLQRNLVLYSLT